MHGFIEKQEQITLLPDGSISLMANIGDYIQSNRFNTKYHNGIYIVGPMRKSDIQGLQGQIHLIGVNFKPGGFSHFYQFDYIQEITDQVIDFDRRNFPDIKSVLTHFEGSMNRFYLDRFIPLKMSPYLMAADISAYDIPLKVQDLAKKYYITERQLERAFKQYIGLSPKEYCDLERFRRAMIRLENRHSESLSEIAWESGYYDHAHMTNAFKKYTDKTPSAFILSDLSKSVSSGSA